MKRAVRWLALMAFAIVGGTACDDIATELGDENTAPTASATTSSTVVVGMTVTLDGSASSDADGDDLTYMWTLLATPSASAAQLTNADAAEATFEADEPGLYVAELQVSDGTDSAADTVEVTAANRAPVALALPDTTVAVDSTVQLDGSSSSDVDGHPLTFSWVLETPAGSGAALSDPTAESPTFTADAEGVFRAILTVDDGWETAMDTAEVTAIDPGTPPSIDAVGTAGNIAFGVPHTVYVEASDADGNPLTYEWSLASGAGSLSFPAAGSDADTTDIQVDAAGEYRVEIAVSDGFNVTTDTLDFVAYDPRLSDITSDTTIVDLLNADYTAPLVTVSAALTVDPGVVVRFDQNDRLIIDTGGSLSAVGTATDSIRFLGAQGSAGYWDGIEVRTVNAANELAYVEVAHGGDGGYANVYVTGSGEIAIHDSRIHSSNLYGVEVESGGSIEGFANNTLRDNASGAVRLLADAVGQLDNGSSYGVQSGARVVIDGGTASVAATWPATDIPYLVNSVTTLAAVITIEPGAELRVAQNDRIVVANGGALQAVGTMADSIRFRGAQASAGYWDGIEIQTVNGSNQLDYVEVAHGGDGGYANVYVTGSGAVTVTNSRIHDASSEGIYVELGGSLPGFATNEFADNATGALSVPLGNLGELDNASTYGAGSTGLYIEARGAAATTSQTWPKTDVPFQLAGVGTVQAAVTVEPGFHMQSRENHRLVVGTGGSLNAVGTSSDSIRFTGTQDSHGWWDGIEIQTNSADNVLAFAHVANGGDGGFSNVYVTGAGQVQLSNSVFRRSSTHGVIVEPGGGLVNFGSNAFRDNQGAALQVPAEELGQLDGASTYAGGNTSEFIRATGTVTSDATWPSTDAPILITGVTTIESAVTIAAGADLRVEENDRLVVQGTNGQITAVGTSTDTITFQGLQGSAGWWDGIEIISANNNTFDYVDIGHGGDAGYANLYITAAGAATLSNSFIHDSATYGVIVEAGGTFVDGGNNSYSGNADGTVQIQ